MIAVFNYALKVFASMQLRFVDAHSLEKPVRKERKNFWNIFHSMVKNTTQTIPLSKMFVKVIEEKVIEKVKTELCDEMKSFAVATNSDKTKLLFKVLGKLIDQDWSMFRKYICDAKNVCKEWLEYDIKEEYFEEDKKKGDDQQYFQRANLLVNKHIQIISTLIRDIWNEEVGDEERKLTLWLKTFQEKGTQLGFADSDFSTMTVTVMGHREMHQRRKQQTLWIFPSS